MSTLRGTWPLDSPARTTTLAGRHASPGCLPLPRPLSGPEAQERIGVEVARKLSEHSDSGTSVGAVNFPQAQLPPGRGGARYVHVHQNAPGLLEKANKVFSRRGFNITGQVLQTDGELGCVLMEAEGPADAGVLAELSGLDGTIRARLLLR